MRPAPRVVAEAAGIRPVGTVPAGGEGGRALQDLTSARAILAKVGAAA